MLKNPRVCSCFMIKTPLKLMKRSLTTPFFFMGLISLSYVLLLLCIFPFITDTKAWFIVDTALIGVSFFYFLMSALKDPGYL
jgi:hypothetical protein